MKGEVKLPLEVYESFKEDREILKKFLANEEIIVYWDSFHASYKIYNPTDVTKQLKSEIEYAMEYSKKLKSELKQLKKQPMKKRRSFWKYNVDNWPSFLALAFIFAIGYASIHYRATVVIWLMVASFGVLIFKSLQDWKRNG